MASRIAISFVRAVPRASSMFAMSRHAMRSTPPDNGINTADSIAGPVSSCGCDETLTRESG
jgi:hypothetical protein